MRVYRDYEGRGGVKDRKEAKHRVADAFREASKGKYGDRLLTKMSGRCCNSCMGAEMDFHNPKNAGFAGYSVQAARSFAEGYTLYINYHAQEQEEIRGDEGYFLVNKFKPYTDTQIGERVFNSLKNNMLDVRWSGREDDAIQVHGLIPRFSPIVDPTTGYSIMTEYGGFKSYIESKGIAYNDRNPWHMSNIATPCENGFLNNGGSGMSQHYVRFIRYIAVKGGLDFLNKYLFGVDSETGKIRTTYPRWSDSTPHIYRIEPWHWRHERTLEDYDDAENPYAKYFFSDKTKYPQRFTNFAAWSEHFSREEK